MQVPPGAPLSDLFELRETPHSGRAVFATQYIAADTVLWRSPDVTLTVLLREYRREVCAQCFNYEYGRDLRIRDQSVGFAFCSEACQKRWREEQGEVGVEAWEKVEKLVKGRSKEDAEMVDVGLPRPKKREIEAAWEGVKAQGELIRIVRQAESQPQSQTITSANKENRKGPHDGGEEEEDGEKQPVQVTKQHRKALQKALLQPISPDVMTFCVSGLIWKYHNPSSWDALLALASDSTPYHNTDDLRAFTRTYLHLLSILPLSLLPLCTPSTLLTLSQRDSHNSFGIRSLEDDGSEFFGYGCWLAASYFNHSCGPNVEKRRVGRTWEFRAGRDIEEGEECCITYLSGEERKLSRGKRQQTLMRNWGFECGCERCEEA